MQATTGRPVSWAAATAKLDFGQIGHGFDDDAVRPGVGDRAGPGRQKRPANRPRCTWPIISITPLGPIEAKTVARPAAARREISTPRRLISATRSARPCRARMKRLAPKVFVRMTWLPASTYARATSSTASGCVRFQASGQVPSGMPRCWSSVPRRRR